VTSAMRSEAMPELPTVGEFVPGYEISGWYGVGAPKGTPTEVIDKLNREINEILADPKAKARLAEQGGTVLAGSPADFGKTAVFGGCTGTIKWQSGVAISCHVAAFISLRTATSL